MTRRTKILVGIFGILAAAVLMTNPASPSDPSPRATVEQGRLLGRQADGVASFKAIPYAAPPVGPLRWRAPQPAAAWQGAVASGERYETELRMRRRDGAAPAIAPGAGAGDDPQSTPAMHAGKLGRCEVK